MVAPSLSLLCLLLLSLSGSSGRMPVPPSAAADCPTTAGCGCPGSWPSLRANPLLPQSFSLVQGLCTQFHLQGFSPAGVCRGSRGICLSPDTAPTSQGPTPTQLKFCSLWRCLSMPAGVGSAPLGPLGLCTCGDTIPWSWQDCPLPAVCALTRVSTTQPVPCLGPWGCHEHAPVTGHPATVPGATVPGDACRRVRSHGTT